MKIKPHRFRVGSPTKKRHAKERKAFVRWTSEEKSKFHPKNRKRKAIQVPVNFNEFVHKWQKSFSLSFTTYTTHHSPESTFCSHNGKSNSLADCDISSAASGWRRLTKAMKAESAKDGGKNVHVAQIRSNDLEKNKTAKNKWLTRNTQNFCIASDTFIDISIGCGGARTAVHVLVILCAVCTSLSLALAENKLYHCFTSISSVFPENQNEWRCLSV